MASTTAKKLTPRQQRVKDLLDEGKTPTEIAKVLRISTAGVNSHLRAIRRTAAAPANGNGASVGPTESNTGNGTMLANVPNIVELIRGQQDAARARAQALDEERDRLQVQLKVIDDEYADLRRLAARHERALEAYADGEVKQA